MALPAPTLDSTAMTPSARRLPKWSAGYIFILPPLLLYAIFFIYPFIVSIYYSFVEWPGAGPKQFVGLANYRRLLSDGHLWEALQHNLLWVVVGTIAPIAIGLLLGALLWRGVRGMVLFRTIYFIPVVLSEPVIGIIWDWIYNPLFGALNTLLVRLGLEQLQRGWLGDPSTALPSLLVTAIWSYFGFAFVVIMAGLQDVNLELVEAAMIDGANAFQRFRYILIPELRHVLTMITALTLIGGFNVFGIVFVMTSGGPGTATEVIGTYTFKKAFGESDIGYGATLSLVMTAITMLASYIFIRLRERNA
ncbi:MAG: sugar ABC transporter permease [Chloroflexota bacterium]|nr:sugar ABC transporter permease [Chloroflexota bacterium]